MPKVMRRHLALNIVMMLNIFPAKGGISSYYSPHQLLNQRNIEYAKHCWFEFGSYVQANHHNEPTNTNEPRTLDGIYLRPLQNTQGGHEIMDLSTGSVITRSKLRVIPMTDAVIRRVNEMGKKQQWRGLTFKNRRGVILPDADRLAGVDYDDHENYDNANANHENYDNANYENYENAIENENHEAIENQEHENYGAIENHATDNYDEKYDDNQPNDGNVEKLRT